MRRRRRPALLWPACLLAVAAAVAALVALEHGGGSGPGAYVSGGVPVRHAEGDAVFGAALPDFVIALDRWQRGGEAAGGALDESRARLEAAAGALPEAVGEAIEALARACRRAAAAGSDELDATADELLDAAGRLNAALAAAGLGYRVEADVISDRVGGRAILLLSFAVERVSLYDAGGHRLRALRARRLDRLNWGHAMLGFSGDGSEDVLVLLDGVERAASLLAERPRSPAPAALNAGDALAEEPWWPEWSATVAGAIDHELAAGPLLPRLVASVERHEVQHLLDRRTPLPVPRALAVWVGSDAPEHGLADVARAELSAYTAELARGDLPHVELALIATYALDDGFRGRGERYAALVLADELARALELDTRPIAVARQVRPERVIERFAALLARSDDELREAARASWQRLFGRPLAPLRAVDQAGSQSSP